MYFNKILRIWIIDPVDYFLLSMFVGSLLATGLKKYLTEKEAMERLKQSIIKKSNRLDLSDESIFNSNSKTTKRQKIYKIALNPRGGAFEYFESGPKISNEAFNLAENIKAIVERLASFLKERELKGFARIFFKGGRLVLDLLLYKCKIDITYNIISQGVNTQVIIITATAGGAFGFTCSWFSAGATLVSPPVLISVLLLRSAFQQIKNLYDYEAFKDYMTRFLENEELQETIKAVFVDGESTKSGKIQMTSVESNPNLFSEVQMKDEDFSDVIKKQMEEQLGLLENPTDEQIEEIIKTRSKPKGKTVHYSEFIEKIAEDADDVHVPNNFDVVDAEILQEPIKVKIKND